MVNNNTFDYHTSKLIDDSVNKISQDSPDINFNNSTLVNITTKIDLQFIIDENNSIVLYELLNISNTNQVIYFHFTSNLNSIVNNLDLKIFNANKIELPNAINDKKLFQSDIFGSFIFPRSSVNYLLINYTESDFLTFNSTKINLTLTTPISGFNFDLSFLITENDTKYDYHPIFPFESIYWKIELKDNQRVNFTIKEVNSQEVLKDSIIKFYQEVVIGSGDIVQDDLPDKPSPESEGVFTYSWVASGRSILWIEIKLEALGTLGNISISFSFQKSAYSFETAKSILINTTNLAYVNFSDRWSSVQYFRFNILHPGVRVNIFAIENVPNLLENAKIKIFDNSQNQPLFIQPALGATIFETQILEEALNLIDGELNGSFFATTPGFYYFTLESIQFPAETGSFYFSVSYLVPPEFLWSIPSIILSLLTFIGLPIILSYVAVRTPPGKRTYELKVNQKKIFTALSKNPRLVRKKEVPFEKILIVKPSFLLRNILINIVSLDDETSSININFSNIIANRFLIIVPFILSIYWLFDLILFILFRISMLPFRIIQISSLNNTHFIVWFPITTIFAFLIVFRQNSIQNVLKEVAFTFNDLTKNAGENRSRSIKSVDINLITKNLAFVRVLWNQADKAFKNEKYSLFIIRADTAVKKLLNIRFQQLYGIVEERLEFNEIVLQIRNQGFDIPSTKKIEYFRRIRNKVVHSSHLLDEKNAIEIYAYYSKFLTRLGIRI